MTTTDPAGFDSEVTGAFRVDTLSNLGGVRSAELETEQTTPMHLPSPPVSGYVSPYNHGPGPSVIYQHSDGQTFSVADRAAPGASIEDPEDRVRELMIARALLRHALHLVDKELNGL